MGVMPLTGYKRLRVSDFTLAGQTEEITSDVKLPNSRIQAKGDAGAESSNGNLDTEWFINEVDPFIKGAMLDETSGSPFVLGATQKTYTFIKEFYQGANKAYQVFTGVQIGSMTATFELNSKAKLSFSLLGLDNPDILTSGEEFTTVKEICESNDESVCAEYNTKSYNTRKGAIAITGTGITDSANKNFADVVRSVSFTINQNPDGTGALFQTKNIDSSLGDESIDGSVEVWNTQDNRTVALRNSAKNWLDDVAINITLDGETDYVIALKVSLKTPSDSADGNKLAFNIPFQVYDAKNGLKITKS